MNLVNIDTIKELNDILFFDCLKSHKVCCIDKNKTLCGSKFRRIKIPENYGITCSECIRLDEIASMDDCIKMGFCLINEEKDEN